MKFIKRKKKWMQRMLDEQWPEPTSVSDQNDCFRHHIITKLFNVFWVVTGDSCISRPIWVCIVHTFLSSDNEFSTLSAAMHTCVSVCLCVRAITSTKTVCRWNGIKCKVNLRCNLLSFFPYAKMAANDTTSATTSDWCALFEHYF